MNRSLAALAAGAMLMASVPTIGFADESSSASSASSVSSSSSSSVSSSSTVSSESEPTWKRPCNDLTGLKKAQCIVEHNPGKGNKKDRQERTNDGKALRLSSDCKDKEGAEKVQCIRTHGKKGIKTMIKKAVKHEMMRTVRGKKFEGSSSSESFED